MDADARREVRELDEADISAILARNFVGRLAFASGEEIEIQPIGFVYHEGSIYGRTAPGTKLRALSGSRRRVGLEVDEIDSMFHWRSVVVHGDFQLLDPRDTEPAEWERVVALLRRAVPDTFTDRDPIADRAVVFRIRVASATGRAME